MKRTVPLALLGIAVLCETTLLASPTVATGTAQTVVSRSYIDSSGIAIVGSRVPPSSQLPSALADALASATRAADADPRDLSFPWVDRSTGQIVVPAASEAGLLSAERTAHAIQGKRVQAAGSTSTPLVRVTTVKFSQQYLQKILDDTIGQGSSVTVRMDYPDPENDRVMLEVNKLSPTFLQELAHEYDPSAIAVHVADDIPNLYPQFGRNTDASPFYGGAKITANVGCTDAFPFVAGKSHYMVTAGHCAIGGATKVTTPSDTMGYIISGDVSWGKKGSVKINSQWRGDIALIRMSSGKSTLGHIYTGPAGGATNLPVKAMWTRSPELYDEYCTGGAVTGQICSWTTEAIDANVTYSDGTIARHVSVGEKLKGCTKAGDSGGPVYTITKDERILAKGIHSGGGGGGGTICMEVYSDIWDAFAIFPGEVQLG